MRVIAGEFRSRRLLAVAGTATRPTPDRLRETLFNILGPRVQGARFVDGYAGTGAVGIEALSRGAASAVFIEKNRLAVETIKRNLEALGIASRARVIQGSAHLYLGGIEKDLVFLDPPYLKETDYLNCLDVLDSAPPALTVLQHSIRLKLPDIYRTFSRARFLRQGDNALSFYSPNFEK